MITLKITFEWTLQTKEALIRSPNGMQPNFLFIELCRNPWNFVVLHCNPQNFAELRENCNFFLSGLYCKEQNPITINSYLPVCLYVFMDVIALSACLQACLPPARLSSPYPSVCNLLECFSAYTSPLSTTSCLPVTCLSIRLPTSACLLACRPLSQSVYLQPVFYLLIKPICLRSANPPVCPPPPPPPISQIPYGS